MILPPSLPLPFRFPFPLALSFFSSPFLSPPLLFRLAVRPLFFLEKKSRTLVCRGLRGSSGVGLSCVRFPPLRKMGFLRRWTENSYKKEVVCVVSTAYYALLPIYLLLPLIVPWEHDQNVSLILNNLAYEVSKLEKRNPTSSFSSPSLYVFRRYTKCSS